MSALARAAAPAVAPPPRTGYLRLVPQRRSKARRAPFVAVVVGLLAGGLLSLLALNTVLAQDAFRLHELQVQGRQLADREQELTTSVERLQAPRAIAERAAELGMVPGGPPAFLRLPDGAVLGQGGPVQPAPELLDGATSSAPQPQVETPETETGTGTGTTTDAADDATAGSPR